ncbi:MAG: dTMP kinase [Hyphomicrobiales bacterium]|nr:dTMP kinase [Hyphomicrobiales bacterium]
MPAAKRVRKGRFITFEGGEGAGKSTQVKRLVEALAARKIETVATREPGGSPNAEELRKALLAGLVAPLGPAAEAMIFSAARIDHLDALIKPALARGAYVVCDRFADSTRAYQGALGKLSEDFIDGLERVTVGDAMPDLTFMLDLPAEDGLARAGARRGNGTVDRFEAEKLDFHLALRDAFKTIAARNPQRCVVIDASRSADDVAADVWRAVETRLLGQKASS